MDNGHVEPSDHTSAAVATSAARMNVAQHTFTGTVTWREDAGVFQLVPAPVSVVSLVTLNLLYAIITGAAIWAVDRYADGLADKRWIEWGMGLWMLVVALAVTTLFVYMHRRAQRGGPWVTFHKSTQEFELPRVGQRFRRDEVLVWLVTTTRHRLARWEEVDVYDHWLVTQRDGVKQRWHVLDFNANIDRCQNEYLAQLSRATGLKVVRVTIRAEASA